MFDALTSDRPYRGAWTKEEAIEHIKASAGSQFDKELVKKFVAFLGEDKSREQTKNSQLIKTKKSHYTTIYSCPSDSFLFEKLANPDHE